MVKIDRFSSRWGLILASLGMAVGAGNIWRFPRVVASEFGGGAFMVAWLIALFVWSIPLLIIESWWGKCTRKAPIGAFISMAGRRWAWAGGFVVVCCCAIMFYYAVVSGWCTYYFARSAFLGFGTIDMLAHWQEFVNSGWSVVCLIVTLVLGVGVIWRGVQKGIENVSRVLVPTLFVLLLLAAIRAVSLPGSGAGLQQLFRPNFQMLLNHRVWIEAFSQSAWSTGAGWGLLLVYAGYSRKQADTLLNACITGLGNNAASLLAGFAVIPTMFALLPQASISEAVSGNEGLAFVWMPRLFSDGRVWAGEYLLVLFFLALAVAALSSLIAMLELGVRSLMDVGLSRKTSALVVGLLGVVFGLPSALSSDVFANQDFVWGVGLLLSGLLFALGTMVHGVGKMRLDLNRDTAGFALGRWFEYVVRFFIPIAFAVMLGWWLYQAVVWNPDSWWNPLARYSLSSCLLQWMFVIGVLLLFNKRLAQFVMPHSISGKLAKLAEMERNQDVH